MSLTYSIKIRAYRFFNTKTGKFILKLLSPFVYVRGLEKSRAKRKFPFIVSITIDAESGYTGKNDWRIWQNSSPEAYIGFYKGIENWRQLFKKYGAKATFFLSTNCFSSKAEEYKKIMRQLRLLLKEKHEIGLHVHPDSDLALQEALGKKFNATSSEFYTFKEINDMIAAGKNLIKNHLGVNVSSFRWGNWGLNTNAVIALQKNGFNLDSSATPGIRGHLHDKMSFDWSRVSEHNQWRLSSRDYQNTMHQNSNILEIPIATFNFFGFTLRADPANSVLLSACFDYYYKHADRSKRPFIFVVISHSTEGTHADGSKTKALDIMEDFLMHSKTLRDVRLVTLQHAFQSIK